MNGSLSLNCLVCGLMKISNGIVTLTISLKKQGGGCIFLKFLKSMGHQRKIYDSFSIV